MSYENLDRLPDPNTNINAPGFVSQKLLPAEPGMMHELNSGGTIGVAYAGSYWTISLVYPELTLQEHDILIPFLFGRRGSFTNFYVQLPDKINPKTGAWSTGTSALIAKGDISRVAVNKIEIPDWSTTGGNLQSEDLFKFDDAKKIYMVAGTSLVSDVMTITTSCDIIETATQISTYGLEPNDVKFRVRLVTGAPHSELNSSGLYSGFTLNLRENIL